MQTFTSLRQEKERDRQKTESSKNTERERDTHTHTQTHRHTDTHTHTCMHIIFTHTHTCSCTLYSHTHTHTHTDTHTHTQCACTLYSHTHTHTHTHECSSHGLLFTPSPNQEPSHHSAFNENTEQNGKSRYLRAATCAQVKRDATPVVLRITTTTAYRSGNQAKCRLSHRRGEKTTRPQHLIISQFCIKPNSKH